ncbi:hypothetical protein ACFDTO_30625 [Microbacteriaceae bacterium 4G12]
MDAYKSEATNINFIMNPIIDWLGLFALIILLLRGIRAVRKRNWKAFAETDWMKDLTIGTNIWILLLWIPHLNIPYELSYILDFFYKEFMFLAILESFLIGMICSTAIYFFTKNKWGSILLSVPFSALYQFLIYRQSFHVFLIIVVISLQYLLITQIEKKKVS